MSQINPTEAFSQHPHIYSLQNCSLYLSISLYRSLSHPLSLISKPQSKGLIDEEYFM
jgi:hypothetical protein